jgi:uncharacterized protein
MSSTPPSVPNPLAVQPEEFDELDALLDGLRERAPEAPQWEFCDGFMAALICCRTPILPAEYWPVLFDTQESLATLFGDAAKQARFEELWLRRWQEIASGLDAEVESLEDERAYCPQVLDVRGALAAMSPEERAEALSQAAAEEDGSEPELPSFAQVWALGFMLAVETWPDEWTVPARDKEANRWLDEAMATLAVLCEDDDGPAEVSAFEADDGTDAPPSMSAARLEAFGEGVWAVYDLRQMGRTMGPRVVQVRHEAPAPGRNDLCPCGSGKKFKKCHGAS